eukprot:Gb_29277 [translate_table: standard]
MRLTAASLGTISTKPPNDPFFFNSLPPFLPCVL